ncbi:MAG: PilZ domain-containing protein [Myxococcota bacterium]
MAESQVRIVDDGELSDVRAALSALGVSFEEGPDGASDGEIPLLVTSASHARGMRGARRAGLRHHLHLVVSDAEGESLKGVPCDFLLRRPVSKEVLRLLTERACYEGPERRRMTRVAMGAPVTVALGVDGDVRTHDAILAQLSIGGCGLVSSEPLDFDAPVRVALPRELTKPRSLELPGRVLSSRSTTTADGATYDVSVVFDQLRLSDRVTLRAIMAGQPIDFRPQADAALPERSAPRRGLQRRPVAGRFGVARVVIGRDLTAEGMRIELDPTLRSGDELELALYGSGGSQAVLLRGRAERDLDEEAWRVRFENVSEAAAHGIERLRKACARDGPGFVIAEILEG